MRSSTLVGGSLKTRNGFFPTGKLWLSFLVIASKSGEYAEDGVSGFAVRVTARLRLTEAVRDKGRELLPSLSTAAMMSGRVAVIMNKSLGGVGEVPGAKKRR